jgi:murein L,D-transpeptidase YcbB/YkuD
VPNPPRLRHALVAATLLLGACERERTPEQRVAEAPPPEDPVARALRLATKDDTERAFYRQVGWRPAWNADAAAQLARAIDARAAHALDRKRFATGASDNEGGGTREERDVALTRAALAYAGALARGAADPKKLYAIYTVPRPAPDLAAGLAGALKDGRVEDWIESLAPQDPAYKALARAYRDGPVQPATPAPVCTTVPITPAPGTADLDPLGNTADVAPAPVAEERTVCKPAPAPPAAVDRASLAVAMERLRWLERTPPATRIDVNIATARLTYWRGGAIADSRVVVVGAPQTKTPQIGSPIFQLVANPTWTIPKSIIAKDRMAARSAASLARSGMAWKNGRIVQKPGPRNSLGLVKFDMRNPYAIYLHDTPAKGLFAAKERHRSHGCVRVKDALGFAALLAQDMGAADKWAAAHAREKTGWVPLGRELPVRLIYATVLLDEGDAPVRVRDAYGWDAGVAKALGFGAVASGATAVTPVDEGP